MSFVIELPSSAEIEIGRPLLVKGKKHIIVAINSIRVADGFGTGGISINGVRGMRLARIGKIPSINSFFPFPYFETPI